MIVCDQQREENFQEYLRLLKDPNYYDVTFDKLSGGVSAVHKDHQFDKKMGPFGIRKGDYEINAVAILRRRGNYILLESEMAPDGVKTPDGVIDGVRMDIKAVEGNGKWAIKDKYHDAVKKGVECIIFYFHKKDVYSEKRLYDGWIKFIHDKDSQRYPMSIKKIISIVETRVIEWETPK